MAVEVGQIGDPADVRRLVEHRRIGGSSRPPERSATTTPARSIGVGRRRDDRGGGAAAVLAEQVQGVAGDVAGRAELGKVGSGVTQAATSGSSRQRPHCRAVS